jgi:hypothetical protein
MLSQQRAGEIEAAAPDRSYQRLGGRLTVRLGMLYVASDTMTLTFSLLPSRLLHPA